jgi:uncharacterized protein (DUF1330 family)
VFTGSASRDDAGAESRTPGGSTGHESGPVFRAKPSTRYYQVVFLWLKDPPKFSRYLELAAPVVRRYGGDLERMLVPDTIYAEGVKKPDVVNIVYYDSRDAFHGLNKDPDFKAVVHLRSESIDMISIEGAPIAGNVSSEALANRVYLLEVGKFGAEGADGYRRYQELAEPVMKRYGYHVERIMSADSASGFPFTPDVVKVAYFDTPDGLDRMQKDPAHAKLDEAYPASVPQSIWIVGKVHPQTIGRTP